MGTKEQQVFVMNSVPETLQIKYSSSIGDARRKLAEKACPGKTG
jgi:hypothetical protein